MSITAENGIPIEALRIDAASNEPLYVQLRRAVEAGISKGLIRAGQRLPTEVEISKALGVSSTTIKNALMPLVDAGVLYRRPRLGTFVGGQGAARRLEIALVNMGGAVDAGFPSRILGALTARLKERGYEPVLRVTDAQETRSGRVECEVVVGPASTEYLTVRRKHAPGYPVIFVDVPPVVEGTDCVYVDNEDCGLCVTRELIRRGARRVIFYGMGGHDALNEAGRLAGYRQALEEAGIGYAAELVTGPEKGKAPSVQLAEAIEGVSADGVFLANGGYCGSLLLAMKRLGTGRREPFIGGIGLSPDGVPGAVDMRVEADDVGRAAAEMLIDRLRGTRTAPRAVAVKGRMREWTEEGKEKWL